MAKTWKTEVIKFGESGRLASSIKSAEKSWCAGVFRHCCNVWHVVSWQWCQHVSNVGGADSTAVGLGKTWRHFSCNVKLKNCYCCAEENTNVRIFITAMEKAAWPGLNIGGWLSLWYTPYNILAGCISMPGCSIAWHVCRTYPRHCDYLFSATTVTYICTLFFIMLKQYPYFLTDYISIHWNHCSGFTTTNTGVDIVDTCTFWVRCFHPVGCCV